MSVSNSDNFYHEPSLLRSKNIEKPHEIDSSIDQKEDINPLKIDFKPAFLVLVGFC